MDLYTGRVGIISGEYIKNVFNIFRKPVDILDLSDALWKRDYMVLYYDHFNHFMYSDFYENYGLELFPTQSCTSELV